MPKNIQLAYIELIINYLDSNYNKKAPFWVLFYYKILNFDYTLK